MSDWSPEQYHRFREQRRQPWRDLVDMVRPRPGMRAADLGCGTGELTRALHERLGAVSTVGVDSSHAMLAGAGAHAGGGVRFEHGLIEELDAPEGGLDLVFSNAALHWVGDHPRLLGRLSELLAPEGQLAIQVPANHDHPASWVADAVAGEAPFTEALGGYQRGVAVLDPREYAELLDVLGYTEQRVELRVYGHHLPDRSHVFEWVRGALLTAYAKRMDAASFEAFCARYLVRLYEEIPDRRPYFFTYKRILMWAQRPA
jgi:trans-aconitate 2-methyltransferase